ncbi:hypothetical protein DEU56DRAFT_908155 [Suillus clintonianus]|uniref:uncharacterized protein n=1 Tax=Suillus clintonianus TaxID=1904413 RepID=UPI001B86F55A|nr:uncharacterized protein DEU56DRAFT_908155 [Suillus clintonianus]KAG2151296.1 hypothetical protein DEU56DRAFT_908155 [Suillus clintonianus]
MTLFAIFSALLLAFATAAPVQPVELLAWSPTILCPTRFTMWPQGSTQTVTWATNNIPDEKKNSTGLLLFGFMANDSENLDIQHPLAVEFPITDGMVTITVPENATVRNNAIVVLFGDSGNASPQFAIV